MRQHVCTCKAKVWKVAQNWWQYLCQAIFINQPNWRTWLILPEWCFLWCHLAVNVACVQCVSPYITCLLLLIPLAGESSLQLRTGSPSIMVGNQDCHQNNETCVCFECLLTSFSFTDIWISYGIPNSQIKQ